MAGFQSYLALRTADHVPARRAISRGPAGVPRKSMMQAPAARAVDTTSAAEGPRTARIEAVPRKRLPVQPAADTIAVAAAPRKVPGIGAAARRPSMHLHAPLTRPAGATHGAAAARRAPRLPELPPEALQPALTRAAAAAAAPHELRTRAPALIALPHQSPLAAAADGLPLWAARLPEFPYSADFSLAAVTRRAAPESGSYAVHGREAMRPRAADEFTELRLESGRRLRIGGPLGAGSFGKVSLAVDEAGRYYAAKVLTTDTATAAPSRLGVRTDLDRDQVVCELSGLRGLGIETSAVAYRGKHGTKLRHVVLTPLMAGTLSALGRDIRAMPEGPRQQSALALARDTADYVARTIHRRGQLHNDLKAENMLVGRDGRISQTDAGNIDRAGRLSLQYTATHRAPEVGVSRHGIEADYWAWAMMMGEAFAGRLPWQQRSDAQLAERAGFMEWLRAYPMAPESPYTQWMHDIAAVVGGGFTMHLAQILGAPTLSGRAAAMAGMRTYLDVRAPAEPTVELRGCAERRYQRTIQHRAPEPFAPAVVRAPAPAPTTEAATTDREAAQMRVIRQIALEVLSQFGGETPWLTTHHEGGGPPEPGSLEHEVFTGWAQRLPVPGRGAWTSEYDAWFTAAARHTGSVVAETLKTLLVVDNPSIAARSLKQLTAALPRLKDADTADRIAHAFHPSRLTEARGT